MSEIIIRKLNNTDEQDVFKILVQFPSVYPEDYVMSLKRGGIRWLLEYSIAANDLSDAGSYVMQSAEGITGHIAYLKDHGCFAGGVFEIKALAVKEEMQGRNYGRMLIRYLENLLQTLGARIIWLQVGEEELVRYYEKLDYRQIAEYPNYWGKGKHRIVMLKEF